jgi:hypothetical protein
MMQEGLFDRSNLERGFENLISTSKLYIDNRKIEELRILRNHIEMLKTEVEKMNSHPSEKIELNDVLMIRILKKATNKFQETSRLLDKIRRGKPIYKEIDTRRMLDILLENIKCLLNVNDRKDTSDKEKLRSDLKLIECLEDQHKRVLLTFLMQDWHNLNEVLTLTKVCEIYKNIAEDLIDISLLIDKQRL